MAFSATTTGRSYSIGPVKQQRATFAAASGDTSGTITFDSLTSINSVLIAGVTVLTQSIAGNVVTITFVDPVNTIVGCAEAHGV